VPKFLPLRLRLGLDERFGTTIRRCPYTKQNISHPALYALLLLPHCSPQQTLERRSLTSKPLTADEQRSEPWADRLVGRQTVEANHERHLTTAAASSSGEVAVIISGQPERGRAPLDARLWQAA
jgi:hypothetical protein